MKEGLWWSSFLLTFLPLAMGIETEEMADSTGGKRSIKQAMDELIAEVDRETKVEADRKARAEAMRPVREQAERQAKEETERQAKVEAERLAKEASERQAKEEAEQAAKAEAERVAKAEAERAARVARLAQPAPRSEPLMSGPKVTEQPRTATTSATATVSEKGPTIAAKMGPQARSSDAAATEANAVGELTEQDMPLSSAGIAALGLSRVHYDAMGGKEGLTKIANDFYFNGMYVSPLMHPLFAIKDDAHPKHLVLFLMHLMQVDGTYMKLRENSYYAVKTLHANARHNPERDRCPAGAGTCGGHWTVSQRDEWKNLFLRACTRNSVPQETVDELSLFVDRVMKFYGPFTADRGQ